MYSIVIVGMIFFDLPSVSKVEKRNSQKFRKTLLRNGYVQYQESVYIKLARNKSCILMDIANITAIVPEGGKVSALTITKSDFESIKHLGEKKFDSSVFADDIVII